jgi:hypothetical protein
MLELEAHVIGSLSAHALVGTSGAETTPRVQRKQGVDHRILNGDPAGPPNRFMWSVAMSRWSDVRCVGAGSVTGAVALFGSDAYNRADMV